VKALFRYHPCSRTPDPLRRVGGEAQQLHARGGDVHPVRPTCCCSGSASESSPAALDHLCDLVFEHCGVKDVIVVVLPNERTAIHLDMIFTQLDRDCAASIHRISWG